MVCSSHFCQGVCGLCFVIFHLSLIYVASIFDSPFLGVGLDFTSWFVLGVLLFGLVSLSVLDRCLLIGAIALGGTFG